MCLTFTIKSAQEMRQRVAKLIGNGLESRLILGTFHSVCRRYLVKYGHLIGLEKGFGIADTSDSKSIIKRIIDRLKLTIDVKKAQSRISSSKSRGIRSTDLEKHGGGSKHVDQQEFITVFEAYDAQLETSNLLDYDDLLLKCVDLLRQHPECVSNVEVVLIDEFQDTNIVQFDLMRLFATFNKRITTVGDPDQSIYGWRSAEIKNLGRMQTQYPDTLVIHLEDNYRSSAAILLAAREIIEQDESRPSWPILPTHCPGTVPVLRKLPTADIEAKWIVSEIVRSMGMAGGLLKHADFAILIRSAQLSRQIESAMGKAGIPYRMVGGKKFFERAEIKTLLGYLQVVSQPNNSDALARIINIPCRNIGLTTTKAFLEEADTRNSSLWDLVQQTVRGHIRPRSKISKQAERAMGILVNIIITARNKVADLETPHFPEDVLKYIIKKIGYRAYLERNYGLDHESRWANVEELMVQASDYDLSASEHPDWDAIDMLPQIEGLEQAKGNTGQEALSKFLANIMLATELQREETNADGEATLQSQVTISTIHAAKGLEWPVVFIPSAYDGSIPHSRAEDTDEERRLLYVAMTRAQALLNISCPIKNSQRGESIFRLAAVSWCMANFSAEDTTISPFLSSKNASQYFVPQAPALNMDTVQDISRILKRERPSEVDILEGYRTVESRDDNLWPLNGEQDPEVMESRWNKGNEDALTSYKRRRTESSSMSDKLVDVRGGKYLVNSSAESLIRTTTTMQNRSTFSDQCSNGFVSAATQLHHAREDIPRRSTLTGKIETASKLIDRSQHGDVDVGISKTIKKSVVQGSLLSFWSAKTEINHLHGWISTSPQDWPLFEDAESKKNGEQESEETDARTANIAAMGAVCGKAHKSNSSANEIPKGLADHKLPSFAGSSRLYSRATERKENTKQYIFLSSSPPPCEYPQKGTMDTSGDNHPSIDDQRTAKNTSSSSGSINDFRPATTFHSTSLAQVREVSNLPKKTLGVRRSMAGWSSRGSQGFSVPSRATTMPCKPLTCHSDGKG